MSAIEALRAAHMAGVDVRIDGDKLALEAKSKPPPAILELLVRNKPEIIALLQPKRDGRDAEDWRAHYEERAGIAEYDGGLKRDQAEARALACCVTEWINRNHAGSPLGQCLACGGSDTNDDLLLPYGGEAEGHAWLHQRCWPGWYAARQAEAAIALAALGIPTTAGD